MKARLVGALVLLMPGVSAAQDTFTYDPPGTLTTGSGRGRVDTKIYAPDLRFPVESGPAFANSQVWGNGGGQGEGSQCDEVNFSYPWHDNFCESRSYEMPLCPSGTGHQGQDIRGASSKKGEHWVVAVSDGTITQVGSYSVYLTAEDGTRFDYLHMQDVQVEEGDAVTRGQRIGTIGNQFGGTPTTVHLHFNIRQNVAGFGAVFVPPYMSLVDAYDRLLNPRPDAGIVDASAPEAGVVDAAPAAPLPVHDAGPPGFELLTDDEESGCSAAAGPAGSAGLWMFLVAAMLRRRRASAGALDAHEPQSQLRS
jgi:uncharacterized protein (TIGR03382 family)